MLDARRPDPRRRVGRQGQPRGVGPAARARLPGRRSVRRARASASTATSSGEYARRFAAERGLHADRDRRCATSTATTSRRRAKATRRVPCSACGLSASATCSTRPRSTAATPSLVTGHNLDDEAAVLFGNTMRWEIDYLARQLPVLPARDGFPKKVKPLVRLTERETAAWCVVRGIDYLVDECPMAAGNKHLGYKATLNAIEARVARERRRRSTSNFLERMAPLLAGARGRRARGAAAVQRSAARRRRATSARSAGWSRRRRRTSRCRSSWSSSRAKRRR